MRKVVPDVTFLEQAFEWENLSWVLYPYFWGTRESWDELAAIGGADPDFAAFLRAGSARVIVPARPGFEQVVSFFLHAGRVWGGTQAPAPGDPGYLSLDAEIRAQQQASDDGTAVGDPWEVRLPTDLARAAAGRDVAETRHRPCPEGHASPPATCHELRAP